MKSVLNDKECVAFTKMPAVKKLCNRFHHPECGKL